MNIAEIYDRSYRFAVAVGAKGGPPLRLVLSITPECAHLPTTQLIAKAVCNLLPRISERYVLLDLDVPETALVTLPRTAQTNLRDHLFTTLTNCAPHGIYHVAEALASYDYCFVIGNYTAISARRYVYAWSSGWRCLIAPDASAITITCRSLNPFSCLAAAALAVMTVYHRAEGLNEFLFNDTIVGWSLFDYSISDDGGPDLPRLIDVGRIVEAGLGGTANALFWALQYGPELVGEWIGYEHEDLEPSNIRYLLMNATDSGSKASLLQRKFAGLHPKLQLVPVADRFENCVENLLDVKLGLATVDDPGVRVELQRRGVPVLLNVGTANKVLSATRHEVARIRDEGAACLGCFFGNQHQVIRREREATLSFVVALVGAILGGELVKSYCFPTDVLAGSWLGCVFYPHLGRATLVPAAPSCSTCGELRA